MTAMRFKHPLRIWFAVSVAGLGLPAAGSAQSPQPWQMGLQPAATPVMTAINDFHNMMLVIIFIITAFVVGLLGYVFWRFGAKRNPTPTRTTHNTMLEMVWTVVPVIVLVAVAVPSFRLLYFQDVVPESEMTIKAVGHQWYWSYEYPDHGRFTFDAQMVPDEEIKPGQLRLLETDNAVVLPVDTTIRVIVTAETVLHAWAVPAFGVKLDAVPGRLNETWVRIEREGTYYGQCSELCGVNHGFMPIKVRAVSKLQFAEWVKRARRKFARADAAAPEKLVRLGPAAGQDSRAVIAR